MARPTGIQSRARRIPIDIDDAVQAEADRRGIGWADELRRVYLTAGRDPVAEQAMATGEASSVATKQEPPPPEPDSPPRLRGDTVRCGCAKPTLSAASGMRVCTTCHLPRRQ